MRNQHQQSVDWRLHLLPTHQCACCARGVHPVQHLCSTALPCPAAALLGQTNIDEWLPMITRWWKVARMHKSCYRVDNCCSLWHLRAPKWIIETLNLHIVVWHFTPEAIVWLHMIKSPPGLGVASGPKQQEWKFDQARCVRGKHGAIHLLTPTIVNTNTCQHQQSYTCNTHTCLHGPCTTLQHIIHV